jgi:uncharacterized protein (DUF169 family)
VFVLQQLVREAKSAEELDAAHLKPDKIVGIVDDAHLVGFCVADANFSGHRHEINLINV